MPLKRDQFCNVIFVLQTDQNATSNMDIMDITSLISSCVYRFFSLYQWSNHTFFPVSNNFYFCWWIAKLWTLISSWIQFGLKGFFVVYY